MNDFVEFGRIYQVKLGAQGPGEGSYRRRDETERAKPGRQHGSVFFVYTGRGDDGTEFSKPVQYVFFGCTHGDTGSGDKFVGGYGGYGAIAPEYTGYEFRI